MGQSPCCAACEGQSGYLFENEMEQRPTRKQSRGSKNNLTFNSGDGTQDSFAMNMPQSMMVLSEADELRRRRNTEFARNYDELVDAVDLSSRHHSSLAPTRDLP